MASCKMSEDWWKNCTTWKLLVDKWSDFFHIKHLGLLWTHFFGNSSTGEVPNLGQSLKLRHLSLCIDLVQIFMITWSFNKSIPIQHTLNISKWLLEWKCAFVSLKLFVPDYATRSCQEHVTQWDFTMLKILFFYLFHRQAHVQI